MEYLNRYVANSYKEKYNITIYQKGNKIASILHTPKQGDKANTEHCAQFQNGLLRDCGYKISNNA